MVYPSAWVVDVRKNLLAKLTRYLSMVTYTQGKPVIFTNRASEWSVDGKVCPFIITDLPMPQTPPAYDREADDITRTMMTFYKSIIPKRTSALVNVILFEVVLPDGRSEVHVVFSSDESTLPTPITTYRKIDCQYQTVRTRQYISNDSNDESFWQDGESPQDATTDAKIGSKLSARLRRNLDQKLDLFINSEARKVENHCIIFQSHDSWPVGDTFFLLEHELPPLPAGTETLSFDAVRDILEYVLVVALENEIDDFYVVCSVEGMLESRPEVHLMFSMFPEPWKATTALGYPSMHYTKSDQPSDSETADSDSEMIDLAAKVARSSTTDTGDQEMRPSRSEFMSKLWTYVARKLRSYDSIESLPPGTAVIFNNEKYLWPEGINYYVLESELLPLPPDDLYNYNKNDIERKILDFEGFSSNLNRYSNRVYASTFKVGEGASAEIHLLITECPELMNLTSRMGLPSHTPPDTTKVPAEYRYYSIMELALCVTHETAYAIIKREAERPPVDAVTGSNLRLEDDPIRVDEKDQKLKQIKLRLGHRLRQHLSRYIHVFKNRPENRKNSAVVFTDDKDLWDAATNPIIKIGQLPSFPPYYDHEKFDIISDMAEYILRKTEPTLEEEPLHLTTLSSGAKDKAEVHFYLSPSKEKPDFCKFSLPDDRPGRVGTHKKSRFEPPSTSFEPPSTSRRSQPEEGQQSTSKMKRAKKSTTPKKK